MRARWQRIVDVLWFCTPVVSTRGLRDREHGKRERNAFELGRDYERVLREPTLKTATDAEIAAALDRASQPRVAR